MGADPSVVSDSLEHEPVVVWTANGDNPVDEYATLDLRMDGNLILIDGAGRQVWSTNTSGHSVRSMNLTCEGNLILLNDTGGVVWRSLDHPTNTWFYGQRLPHGQRLTSTTSSDNYSRGLFYVSMAEGSLLAFVDRDPPVQYASIESNSTNFMFFGSQDSGSVSLDYLYNMFNFTHVRLEPDGRLNLFGYDDLGEHQFGTLLNVKGGNCGYPTACGTYGICFGDNFCSCPQSTDDHFNYFRLVDPSKSNLGCMPVNPLSCSVTQKPQTLVRLDNVTYFGFESSLSLIGVDADSCKRACLQNCSCAAAVFHYKEKLSSGNCSLPSELLTLMHMDPKSSEWNYNSATFIKVQSSDTRTNSSVTEGKVNSSMLQKLVPSVSAALLLLIALSAGACYCTTVMRRKTEKCPSDLVIDAVTRFSFEALRVATQDFQNKLGRGGFGSVFEGTLGDGKRVAVKCLDSVGQGRKEFLAEVNTIGTLHHFNLVKLIGFCEEGHHRLLVYEYMTNGSLDKWIFNHDLAQRLTWSLRRKIICGIAKGLEYLHENCNQSVIHFDIKPQNILLDADFNVKISDFGLAKMVDRDQAQVLTIIRGTPGYIAPELINGRAISVKVDVYSFGILVLEIVCGRKNVGALEEEFLTNLVKVKADEDRLIDLVDVRTEDMQHNTKDAVKMMKIAIWCLQPHFIRPAMSMVAKVFQDLPNMETLTDLSYLTITHEAILADANPAFSTRPAESLLSGPR